MLATFRDSDPVDHAQHLRHFSERDWKRSIHWLDASGLALYFLQRLRALDALNAIPAAIVRDLEQRHASNQQRTRALFAECARINSAFRDAGLRYANLKGFTLAPEYCPDLSLRYQTDCDFLVHARDAARCDEILVALGYSAVAKNDHVMEFKTDAGHVPKIRDLYVDRPQRSVEVHLSQANSFEFHPSLLERAATVNRDGQFYPCLSAEDMFLAQAAHLFRHLRSEWTRASWLLELKTFAARRANDEPFWHTVSQRAAQDQNATLSVGVALMMSQHVFGEIAPEALKSWGYSQISKDVALWIERYSTRVLLTDFPGSKLYLILERAIDCGIPSSRLRQRLFPHRAPKPFMPTPPKGIAKVRATWSRCSYFFFRLRFHIVSGVHYFIESWRWKRLGERAEKSDVGYSADCAASATD